MLTKIRNGLLALLTGVLFALSPASAFAGGIDIEDLDDLDEGVLELVVLAGNFGLLEELIEEAIEGEDEEEEELEEEIEELEAELEEEEEEEDDD